MRRKIANMSQMLWNWHVNDACFVSSSWHITSDGMMAASCIGTALLVYVSSSSDALVTNSMPFFSASFSDGNSKPHSKPH
jgi:hypothetical protein